MPPNYSSVVEFIYISIALRTTWDMVKSCSFANCSNYSFCSLFNRVEIV
nr:MAG TPA: hypothetical protein [Caudoviricetes sp.]